MGGVRVLGLLGVAIALVGAGMSVAPRVTSRFLVAMGLRWVPDERHRVAAWGLILLGLVVVVLSRLVR